MQIDRNKIIFLSAVGMVLAFIILYAMQVMGAGSDDKNELSQPEVPALKEEQKEYSSKLDAINDIKDVRESNATSIYDESRLDSTGLYDPLLQEKERQRIVDSIYREGRIDYGSGTKRNSGSGNAISGNDLPNRDGNNGQTTVLDFSKAHKAFFANVPEAETTEIDTGMAITDPFIMVEVNGEQTVRNDERLELRLATDALINGQLVARNSLVYGFISFNRNRISINITNINNKTVDLKAFDLLDGNEGIYIKNSFQAEATGEVLDDVVQDINIPGVPQIGGIKQVFRRNNRNVKATIYDQYQLILKPSL